MFAAMKSGGPIPDIKPPDQPKHVPSYNNQTNEGRENSRRKPQVKVFNIPENTEQNDLKEFFSSVGNVTFVKILPPRDGKSTTLGFVEFETEEECRKAAEEKDNQDYNGSNLHVVFGNQNSEGPRASVNGSSNDQGNRRYQVKVYNIPDGSDESELIKLFSAAGEVKQVKVLPCRDGKDVTLGFVHYSSAEEVQSAVNQLNDSEFNGSKLRVMDGDPNSHSAPSMNGFTSPPRRSAMSPSFRDERPSRPMGRGSQLLANNAPTNNPGGYQQRKPQAKVFGIPPGTSQDEVIDYFSSAGAVKFVKILPLREGKDNHLGFVEFDTEEEVRTAVETLNGNEFNGSTLKVMSGSSQSNQNSSYQNYSGGNSFSFQANAPTGRIPQEERNYGGNSNETNGRGGSEFMVPDYQSNNCRRCGEPGHYAKECLNAPVGMGTQAVTYIPPPPPDTEEEIFAQGIHEGINFENYEHIPVEFTGNDAPKHISSFEEANLDEVCKMNIKRAEYHKPTPVQKYAIPSILAHRDLMACAQTGSGKTASFLLPMITNMMKDGLVQPNGNLDEPSYPLTAILAPTRELAVQIFQEARKFSYGSPVKVVVIYGGVSVSHQLGALERGCHILVATPGRLEDFIKRGRISFQKLEYLVFDEADRMLDMGFGPQIMTIIENSEMRPKTERTTLMFSATFPEEIQQMAAKYLNNYLFLSVGRVGGTCTDVLQTVVQVPGSKKRNTLEEILQTSGTDRTLVFVEKKKDADFLASFLSQRNYPTTSLNGDRTQQEREAALKDFRAGIAPVLVATAVAGRGLDINDVKHVINYDLPSDPNEYVHRIGRTGRIGNKGKATAFFDIGRDQKLARALVKYLSDAEQEVPDWLEDCALCAVGTGYGPDGGQFQDRRVRNGGGGRFNQGSNAYTGGSSVTPNNQGNDDDDDEEW